MAMWSKCGQSGYITPTSSPRRPKPQRKSQNWLYGPLDPCRLGGPQRSAQGEKAEMSLRPKCGQSGYITRAVSRVPNTKRAEKKQKLPPETPETVGMA